MENEAFSVPKRPTTPPPRTPKRPSLNNPDLILTPGNRRSDRIRKRLIKEIVKDRKDLGRDGDTITTPRGSSIHSKFPEGFNQVTTTPRRVALDQFKRRLQFKDGAMSGVRSMDTYKQLERKEKMEEFHREQRGKRDDAVMKSRGLSLPAISRTRQTSNVVPSKEGEAPRPHFIPRHNLRPRPLRVSIPDIDTLLLGGIRNSGAIEKRKGQYKRLKAHDSVDFVSWKDRDDAWRTKRLASYMSSSKKARETVLFKKRKLNICGWGNPKKNLGNYLSICWEYNPDLNADKNQKLPNRSPAVLNRYDDQGGCEESGLIYYPDVISDPQKKNLNGFCFTIQSELALQYEPAQKVLFQQASAMVQRSFWQYNMDLSLDSSLEDNFTVDIYVSSHPSQDMNDMTVRGVTQFIFMKGYIYVDKICVSEDHQKSGIGALLMDRIQDIAFERKKDILLYALGPVVGVYLHWGFKYCKEWPAIPGDVGVIMRKRIATKDAADDFVGLQWDGTRFA